MRNITLSSCYNFESGYQTILQTLLDVLPLSSCNIRPRSLSIILPIFKKYFENISYNKEDCDLMLTTPCNQIDIINPLFHIAPHRCRLFYTMWESTRVSDIFVDQLNKTKAVMVPNDWNRVNFQNQGCEVPIHVVPLFVDTSLYNYTPPIDSDVFVFGVANDDPRKRLYETIRCFLKAFPNKKDVVLKVKTSNGSLKFSDDRIHVVNAKLTKRQLKDWYCKNDVFVSGVSAEGWGLMQHESMACGRPVVAAAYAGLAEFMTCDNSFCLDYAEVPSTDFWETPGGKWSKYDEDHMIETMRYCYNNRDVVKQKGILASKDVSELNVQNFIFNIITLIDIYIKK